MGRARLLGHAQAPLPTGPPRRWHPNPPGCGTEDQPITRPYGSPDCEQGGCDRERGHPGSHFNKQRDTWFGQTATGEWRVFPRDGVPVALPLD